MNLAIIPARGGSKRIPGKNIKEFCGKPIIAYSIEAAIKSQCFDKIIVSTDDEEIARVAKKFGAEVPFMRPKELSDDFTGTRDVINHAINQMSGIDYVCCIYATAPLVQSNDLKKSFEMLKTDSVQFVVPVTKYEFPIQRSVQLNKDGRLLPMFPDQMKMRSQDLVEAYHDAGQFYWGKKDAFLSGNSVFGQDSIPLIIPKSRVQDIDSLEDWERAESMYKLFSQKV